MQQERICISSFTHREALRAAPSTGWHWDGRERSAGQGAAAGGGAVRCFLQCTEGTFPHFLSRRRKSALVSPAWQRTSWDKRRAVCGFFFYFSLLTGSLRAWGRQNGESRRLKMKTDCVLGWSALWSLPTRGGSIAVHLQCHFPEKQELHSSNNSKPNAQLHSDLGVL